MSQFLKSLHPLHPISKERTKFSRGMMSTGSCITALTKPSKALESTRPYLSTDPKHLVDWKAYARSDQLIVRQTREEAKAKVGVFVDAGATMHWPTYEIGVHGVIAKFELAMRLALHLGYHRLHQGDDLRLYLHYQGHDRRIDLASSQDVLDLFEHCEREGFQVAVEHSRSSEETRMLDQVMWLSDGIHLNLEVLQLGRQAVFVQTLSSLELDFSWLEDASAYIESEHAPDFYAGKNLKRDQAVARQREAWISAIRTSVEDLGGEFFTVHDAVPLKDYL